MANTERLLPRATTALAKTVWERQREPSARKVARALAAAGYPVHFTTVALWKRTGWRAPESRHPLDAARAGLDSIAPVVTGNTQTCIDDLIRNHPERKNFEKLTDAELLRLAAREVAMAVVIIARRIPALATSTIIPPAISIREAAGPPESMGFTLVGALFVIPFILAYTAMSYYVFRGKVRAG